MERMRGIDAGYLYMETPTVHMHTLKIGVLDPSTAPEGYTFDTLLSELGRRLHLLPPFRRRIVTVPLGLHHPMWIEDPAFRLENHVRRVTLSAPGTMAQLDDLVGRIAGVALRRDRPLWDMTVVEGLAGDRIAVVAKVHHSVADGVASAALLANVMDMAHDETNPPPAPAWKADPIPTPTQLIVDALRDRVRDLADLGPLLRDTVTRLRTLATQRRSGAVQSPRPLIDTPRAPFGGSPDARRVFATIALPFADFRRIRTATGVAFNDVVLAVVDGAVIRWLEAQGHRLDQPLMVAVPVSADEEGGVRLSGNRVSSLLTALATNLDDPLERLRAIADVTAQAKIVQRTLGADMLERWVQFTPPGPFGAFMRLYSRLNLADRHAPPVNLVVSNVPGPREPVSIAGATLTDFFSVGPVLDGIPLNITAWSYRDRLSFSVIASPRTCHDVRGLASNLADSLDELLEATGQRAAS